MRKLLKGAKTSTELRRIQCILLRCEERSSEEIGRIVGMHTDSVRHVWSDYLEKGEQALLGEKRGGRHRFHLTLAQEKSILHPLIRKAERGQLLTVRMAHAAVCKTVGKDVDLSTTYRMLSRHGWRKIVPLPTHPKGDQEARERFKESFPPTC